MISLNRNICFHCEVNTLEISNYINERLETRITLVTVARGAIGLVTSELLVRPGCTVYTSQATEQIIKDLKQPTPAVLT